MKDKKTIIFILTTIIISIVLSFFLEVIFFNRNVFRINNTYSPEIIETKDIIKQDNKLVTSSTDSYIKVKIEDSYINKLQFNYKTNDNIEWQIKYNENGEEKSIDNISSLFINKVSREIKIKADYITIHLNNKDITIDNIKINNSIYINWSRVLFFIILFSFILILIKYHKKLEKQLEMTFIILSLTTGALFIMITPKTVYNSWDDQIHLESAQVFNETELGDYSEGFQLITSQDVSNSIKIQSREEQIELYKAINKLDKKTSDMKIQVNNYSPKYNKLVYLPFKIGFVLSDFLHFSLITAIVIAKLLNLLFYTLIIALSIKISSHSIKKIIFIIGLLISNIFLASQLSYDPAITACLILAVASFIKMLEEEKINNKYLMGFILAITWACLPKAIYCLFGLLLLFIPNEKFKSNKQAIKLKVAVTCLVLLLMSSFVLPMILGGVSGDPRGGNTNASAQFSFILHNPISYAKILIKYIIIAGPSLLIGNGTLVGTGYILKESSVKDSIYMVNLVYLLYVTFTNSINKKIITNRIKVLFSFLVIGLLILIPTALYIAYTEVRSVNISGVQARYFIPLLLPLLLIMSPVGKEKENDNFTQFVPLISFLLLMVELFLIMKSSFGI